MSLALRSRTDQEWLDAINAERKKEQMDKVSYEIFEIVMDRLEKEWFDLVCNLYRHISIMTNLAKHPTDQEHTQARSRSTLGRLDVCHMR